MSERVRAIVERSSLGSDATIERRFIAAGAAPTAAALADAAGNSGARVALGGVGVRHRARGPEGRATEDGEGDGGAMDGRTIFGHAAVFNRETVIDMGWDTFTEVIAPGAFARAIREQQDVRCLFNHDADRVLGRTASGTLRLAEDAQGLAYECDAPDTTHGRDVVALIDRGDITGSSFAFRVKSQRWEELEDGTIKRTLLDLDIFDVSPVTFPAYADATVDARGMGMILERRAAATWAGHPDDTEARRGRLEAMERRHRMEALDMG